MMFNIEAALESAPKRGTKRCKVQKILDEIPDENPLKAEFIARLEDVTSWTAPDLSGQFTAGGCSVSTDLIQDHRGTRCACFR